MLCHFTAKLDIGLPLGAWLCFRKNMGAFGLWAGLSLALILIGIVLLFAWRRTVRRLMAGIRPGARAFVNLKLGLWRKFFARYIL